MGERAQRTTGGWPRWNKDAKSPPACAISKELDGKRARLSWGRPPRESYRPHRPRPRAIVFPGCNEPLGSTATAQPSLWQARGQPPGCLRAGRGRGRGRAPTGASQLPLLKAPRGCAASFPTPPLVFIDRSPHPPPPLRPTIRFLKSPFVSQEAGEREGERDAEAEGGGGSLPVASDCSGQEGICRQRGRGLFPRPSAGAAEGVREPPAPGTQRALSPRALDTLGPSSPAGGRSGQPAARAPWAGQTRLSAALAGRGQRGRPLFSFALLPAPLATWALGGCRACGCETTAATLNLSPPRDYSLYSFPHPSAATSPHPQAPALCEPPLFGGWEGVLMATSKVLAAWRGAVGKRIYLRTVPLGTWGYTGFSRPLSLTPAP